MKSPVAFEIYWWVQSDGPRLSRYSTKDAHDIEAFPESRFRIHVRPLEQEDGEPIELILFPVAGQWFAKSDTFADISEEYPFHFSENESEAVWTDAQGDELMVIRALFE